MKLKSYSAAALGVLLFFAGQHIPAQEGRLPDPDRDASALPAPVRDRSSFPASARENSTLLPPDQDDTLPAPGRETSTLPPPYGEGRSLTYKEPPVSMAAWASGAINEEAEKPAAAPAPAASGRPSASPAPAVSSRPSETRPSTAAPSGSPAPRKNALPDRGPFWGVTAGIRSLSYNTDGTDWDGLAVEGNSAPNAGLFIGMDFGKLIIQAEIVLSGDNGTIDNIYSNNFYSMGVTGTSLLIPLIVKRDFHLGPVVFQPLAGLYFNFALGDLKLEDNTMGGEEPYANPPVGLIFGGDVGIALWKGVLFLDLRFAGDLGKTAAGNDPIEIWTRTSFMINLGYQFFF